MAGEKTKLMEFLGSPRQRTGQRRHAEEFDDKITANHGQGRDHKGDMTAQEGSHALSRSSHRREAREPQKQQIEAPGSQRRGPSQETTEIYRSLGRLRWRAAHCRTLLTATW
ncbi:hypothetical protein B0H17DRAFT_1027722 [Mycena rosella]|uniref:Uncharacterized protein n=1 Tax=Mycena rosella TaxID=1033263 RepID=A0AAD7H2S9_MYCRO|nr:hypothetical protein B0H17DRAFT_1027722 [Mycena rosella]